MSHPSVSQGQPLALGCWQLSSKGGVVEQVQTLPSLSRRMPSTLACLSHDGTMPALLLQAGVFQHRAASGNLNSPLPFPLCTTPVLDVPLHFERGSPSIQASALTALHATLRITHCRHLQLSGWYLSSLHRVDTLL